MSFKIRALFFLCTFSFFSYQSAIASPAFASAEHAAAGNDVKVYAGNQPGKDHFVFHLPSGVIATYGEVLSFGDLYGVPGNPISMGGNELERQARFIKGFDSFALDKSVVPEAEQLLQVIHDEQAFINKAITKGDSPEDAYAKYGAESARRYNCITGGGCNKNDWWLSEGRYLKLAKKDYDHFADNAWLAYKTGHKLAMETAILAKNTGDPSKLELAYAMNAFASHFLADRFASGHIRTPRVDLPEHVTPSVLGSVLASYMHNEENQFGLHVHNQYGSRWESYGDHSYFSDKNSANRDVLLTALQASADQIFMAYTTGNLLDDQMVYDDLPFADEEGSASLIDISPLFYWDNNTHLVYRREDVANPYDRHWTSEWWGWSTLALLIKAYGKLPVVAQVELADSKYAQKAIKDGFITEPAIIAHINQKKK